MLRRLILHFDLNETILVGDPAGGDTFEESLNKIISKTAFVRVSTRLGTGRWAQYVWHDGTSLDPEERTGDSIPPLWTVWERPEGCLPFYEVPDLKNQFAKRFTAPESPGHIYRSVYEELLDALRLPTDNHIDRRLSHDGVHHYVIPAFFHTLHQLSAQKRDMTILLRTFGTDGPHVAAAIDAWAEGKHPSVPPIKEMSVTARFLGRYDNVGSFKLINEADNSSLNESQAVELIESGVHRYVPAFLVAYKEQLWHQLKHISVILDISMYQCIHRYFAVVSGKTLVIAGSRCMLIQDHYAHWSAHSCIPDAGKPLWLSLPSPPTDISSSETTRAVTQHIFFDDNIHNKADDSIVAVRRRCGQAGGEFTPLGGEATRRLHGKMLVKVSAVAAIKDRDWFLRQVAACEASWAGGVELGKEPSV